MLVRDTPPSTSSCLTRSRTEVRSPVGFTSSCGLTLATSTIFRAPSTVALGLAMSMVTSTTLSGDCFVGVPAFFCIVRDVCICICCAAGVSIAFSMD